MLANDLKVLPLFLLENETIKELLEAGDIEFHLLEKYILKLRDELNMALCDELLSRYEKIFELLPLGTKRERVYKLLSKLNMDGTARVIDILELAKIITKREAKIIEHYSEYSFDVIVSLLEEDSTSIIEPLRDEIEEIKPAHLAFHIITMMEIMRFKHENDVKLVHLKVALVHRNLGIESHYLNGFYNLDGSYELNQMFLSGLSLMAFDFAMKIQNINNVNGFITQDTMWNLDGSFYLTGLKKINAEIRRSEL